MFTKMKLAGLAGVLAASALALPAFATTCPVGFEGSPTCIATTNAFSEPTLEEVLGPGGTPDSIFSTGDGINPYTEQANPSSYWSIAGSGGSENTVLLTLTGNAPNLVFGIFDPTDTANRLALFSGAGAGYTTRLAGDGLGGFAATYFASANPLEPPTGHQAAAFGGGNLFGYYLTVGNTTWFSDISLNGDDTAHVVTYAGSGQGKIAATNGLFGAGEFLQAWEDGSDFDYQDFVVIVESVHPVPEPTALGMFGLGVLLIGGFAALRRRRGIDA